MLIVVVAVNLSDRVISNKCATPKQKHHHDHDEPERGVLNFVTPDNGLWACEYANQKLAPEHCKSDDSSNADNCWVRPRLAHDVKHSVVGFD